MTIATTETHRAPAALPDQMRFAEALAASNLLPKAYAKQPANVLLAMQLGDALGIPPIQAINGIHVVEGKPTASADLIASLVRRAGHKLRIREEGSGNGLTVTATLIRADDPEFPFEAVWTMGKAQQAGLTGKGVWKQYPGQMLRSRAITEVARMGASDALYGVIYTPEELGASETTMTVSDAPASPASPAPTISLSDALAERNWDEEVSARVGDAEALRTLYKEAKAQGAPAEVLEVIADAGKTAASIPTPASPATPADVVDAEIIEDGAA